MAYKYELAITMVEEIMDRWAEAWDLEEPDDVYALFMNLITELKDLDDA